MPLTAGARFGSYEIVGPLGAGGMGEVYKARDERLHRFVALKFLPPAIEGDAYARRRLEAEARAAAALDHPFICKVFDVGEAEGRAFIVMEAVSGETLRSRIASGPLPIAGALPVALEIAEALAAAHRAGVVHRDLKPANVMIADDGHVKILDFGLASVRPAFDATTAEATSPAVLKGTLAYMSPEQLRHQPIDARTDVFAFGILLYEMLTAAHPFPAPTSIEIASAILQKDPQPWPRDRTPPVLLQHIVRKALAKDAGNRYQSMQEVITDLRAVAADSAIGAVPARHGRSPSRRIAVAAVAAIVALAAIGSAAWWVAARRGPTTPVLPTHRQLTFDGTVSVAALSPDGRTIAYVSERQDGDQLKVQDAGGGPSLEIARAERLFVWGWSPDENRIVYLAPDSNGAPRNFVVSRFGGQPHLLGFDGSGIRWSPDGTQLIGLLTQPRRLRIVTTTGETVRELDLRGFGAIVGFDWDRASGRIAVIERSADERSALWTMTADGGDRRRVPVETSRMGSPNWSAGGTMIYCLRSQGETEDLLAIDMRANGSPRVLLSGLETSRVSVAADGRSAIVVRRESFSNLALWNAARPLDPITPVTSGTADYSRPRFSPDGQWVTADVLSGPGRGIAKIRLPAGAPALLTDASAINQAWSPDGTRILFSSIRGGSPALWTINADGQEATRLDVGPVGKHANVMWLNDGRIAWQEEPGGPLFVREPSGDRVTLIDPSDDRGTMFYPTFSPAGDRVAVSWYRKTKKSGLWVLSLQGRVETLLKDGLAPLGWSADGRSIYAIAEEPRGDVWAVDANTGASRLLAHVPSGKIQDGDVARDGKLIVLSVEDRKSDAWLVQNFDPRVPPRN